MATNVNKKLENLNILQWNVQGLRAKALELSSILSKKKISVAYLQDTLLGDSNWCPTKKYKLEKSPHIGGEQNRGAAILIHATLQYNRVPLHTTLEAAAVTINSTKRYTICSVYLSPNANIDMEELKSLIRQLPRPFLLLGDFNAKHPAWDFENSADPRVRAVQSILVEESVGMFNQGRPTHYHIQTNILSVIDLCLCSVGELWDFQLEVDEDLHGSDHFPIYLTDVEHIPQHQVLRWIIDKANWDQFTEITKQIAGIPDSEPLEFYGQIIGKITEGATKSIPKSDGYYKVAPVPWWNANCANLKKERLKARKQANRRPTVSNKIKYKRLRAMFQWVQKDSQNSSWKYVSTLNSNTEDAKVWKKVDKI